MGNIYEELYNKAKGGVSSPSALTPRQVAARKAAETKHAKKLKRVSAAQKAVVTRTDNKLRAQVEQGYHSADKTFNQHILDAAKGNRKFSV